MAVVDILLRRANSETDNFNLYRYSLTLFFIRLVFSDLVLLYISYKTNFKVELEKFVILKCMALERIVDQAIMINISYRIHRLIHKAVRHIMSL